jgi:protein-disulfide isomerase
MLPLAVNKNGSSVLLPSAYGAGTGVPVFVSAVLIALGAQVANACAELDFAADISHVTNIADILDLGVMRTPAVVIDGEVVISGRVPTVSELKDILERRWA